jgi:hypothetical protein
VTDVRPDELNRLIRYHGEISYALTTERTALESALIPVSAYIVISCIECYRRWPEMIDEIAAAMPPEEIGRAGQRFATEIDPVRMWAVPNFFLLGRKILGAAFLLDTAADPQRVATVLDFWERASGAYRFDDGTHQAADANGVVTPYRNDVDDIAAMCAPVTTDDDRRAMSRLNALLTSYLFLLWFDTRSGYQDTGPYELADGRIMLLRSFNRLAVSHFPWSADVSASMPYHQVVGAFILDGVTLRVTDFGTSVTEPQDYLSHVVEFGLFDVSSGQPVRIDATGRDALAAAAKTAQKDLYRRIAAMERREKIDAGAYVYFTFLRPFAEVAGVDLDWTVPRDSLDLYPLLEHIDGSVSNPNAGLETPEAYYAPLS